MLVSTWLWHKEGQQSHLYQLARLLWWSGACWGSQCHPASLGLHAGRGGEANPPLPGIPERAVSGRRVTAQTSWFFTSSDLCLWPCGFSANRSPGCAVLSLRGESRAGPCSPPLLLLMDTRKSNVMFFLISYEGGGANVHTGLKKGTTGPGAGSYLYTSAQNYGYYFSALSSLLAVCFPVRYGK